MVLPNTTSTTVILQIKNVFARHGIPEVFAKEYGFKHCTSSPKFVQSNGQAENAVKIAKKIFSKSNDPNLGLLAYRKLVLSVRATQPNSNEDSIKTVKTFASWTSNFKVCNKASFDKRHAARELRQQVMGERVWMPDLKLYGKIHAQAPFPRSFIVQTEVQLIHAPSTEMDEKLHGKSGEQYCHTPLTCHNQQEVMEEQKL
ncbi:hypothetical protein PR048_013537 [Dryococelus australis]|uniref:Integrase catalytic domain-containing protein n=1 Tax=Dryococelus australis TaxID=614101 RepID=A0ABQ9HSG6_9NEOP|nr:hypothetical protein PR048_013537 [Dryococelus australis]